MVGCQGYLLLSAAFRPDTQYSISVSANSQLRDGFGLPLQASRTVFRTRWSAAYFSPAAAVDGPDTPIVFPRDAPASSDMRLAVLTRLRQGQPPYNQDDG